MTNTHDEQAKHDSQMQEVDSSEKSTYSDDVQFEDVSDDQNPAAQVKKLRERLRIAEREKKEYLDGWQRMRADFANARKEDDQRRGEIIKFASEGLVEELLPVLDSFTMAFANKEAWEKVDSNWRKGVEYIYAQLWSVLESRGLAEIGVLGEAIDPRLHIEVAHTETKDENMAGKVTEVIQKGYRLHSRVIRPAKVKGGSLSA